MKTLVLGGGFWLAACVAWAASDDFRDLRQQNWHQWRGPLANGVAPLGNPPTKWDENTNIKWKSAIPGNSTATPIVWGDNIYLITAVKTDREAELAPLPADTPKPRFNIQRPNRYFQFILMCIDRQTGQTRWQQVAKEDVPHEGHHPDGSFASASPTTDGKQIYVSFGSRGVHCFDVAGNAKWSRDLGKMVIYNSFGEGCSPVIHGDSLVVNWDHQSGSFIAVLDANTGETKWKQDRDENTTWATPLIVEHDGRTQVIVHGSKRVRSYDLKTGDTIWECGGQVVSAIPCPVTNGNLVFAMTGFMGSALYAIPLDSKGDITGTEKVAWKRNQGTPYVPSPLLYDDLLYFTQSNKGILSCINAKTGEPLIERQRLQGIENIYASPVGAADRVYFTSREGNTVVLKKGPELDILATNKLNDRFDASAVIVGNQLLLRGRENLYCIEGDQAHAARAHKSRE